MKVEWSKAPEGAERANSQGYVRWLKKHNDTICYYHKSTSAWVEYTDQNVANDKWVNSETRPEYDGVNWINPVDSDKGEVTLSMSEFKKLESYKIKYEQFKDSNNVICVIEWPVSWSFDTELNFRKHYFKEALSKIDEMRLTVNHRSLVDIMKNESDNLIKTLQKENETLRSRKWYQFWK